MNYLTSLPMIQFIQITLKFDNSQKLKVGVSIFETVLLVFRPEVLRPFYILPNEIKKRKIGQFVNISQNWLIGGTIKRNVRDSWKQYNLKYQKKFGRKLGQLTYNGKNKNPKYTLKVILYELDHWQRS